MRISPLPLRASARARWPKAMRGTVRAVLDLHSRLWIFVAARVCRAGRRCTRLSRAHRQNPMGRHNRGLLHQPRAGPLAARHSRLFRKRVKRIVVVLFIADRADERRDAIRVRKTIRQNQNRAGRQPIENHGRINRRPRALRCQAQPGRKRLGHHDRRSRRRHGPHGLGQLRRADFLSPDALLFYAVALLVN